MDMMTSDRARLAAEPPRAPPSRAPAVIVAALLLVAAALAVFALLSTPTAPRPASVARARATTRTAPPLPATPPPPVEPVAYADLTPDQARASNAAVPFDPRPMPTARPFLYAGAPADRAAAAACLAAAVLYEAGDDRVGERAVAQVVLNRLRHPAFPKTVCGVVFQGSERTTGCQFTFTCDGSMAHVPAAAAWDRARAVADAALSGYVDTQVGTATHYHTDWVVPYWRDTLTKLTKVETHIFYRWRGRWGERAAFADTLQPFERLDPRLVPLAGPQPTRIADLTAPDADADPAAPAPPPLPPSAVVAVPGVSRAALKGSVVRLADTAAGQFVLQLAPDSFAGDYAVVANSLCRTHADCLVFGWTQPALMPRTLPIAPNGINGMTFLFRKSSLAAREQAYWNCRQKPRADRAQCLPGTG